MSKLTINIDFTGSNNSHTESPANKKHKRFLKRRRFLQRKALLKDKQCLIKNQGPAPRHNGAKPQHRALPSTAAEQHSTSSSHRQSTEPASTSSSPSLTITVKNNAEQSRKITNTEQSRKITNTEQSRKITNTEQSGKITNTEQSRKITNTEQSGKITNAEQSRKSTPFGNTLKPAPYGIPLKSAPYGNPLKYLAIDCEMVGTGPKGRVSELARCSIVSYDGDLVYDKYIKPANPVTDLRTRWSGITWSNLSRATPFADARKEILKLLSGKVVIGHAIHNDFRALGYSHPANLTRDTSRIPLLNHKAGFAEQECASLKRLTKALFNRDIQTGKRGHSSVEDAKATMELYKAVEAEWERTLASRSQSSREPEQS